LIHDWIRQLPVRLEDACKIDRLIEIDESTALAKEAKERPRIEWQTARRIAAQSKRQTPNDDDFAAARKELSETSAKAAADRAAERKKLIDELLATPPRAVMLADAVRHKRLPQETRDRVIEAALLPTTDPAIRDLFESFVPVEQRTQRLGDDVNPSELLRLKGELSRGKTLFHESTVVQCRNCHRIAGKGTELGPDLDSIGKKYDRAKLLENILQPSLQIDPKYKVWLVETKSGQVVTGLMSRRDDQEIVIRDAQNKEHRIPMSDVEDVFPQTKSLMPEFLIRDFTAQQVADLLEYLSSLRADEPAK
jgi:putative heme-binding domain-containing protein